MIKVDRTSISVADQLHAKALHSTQKLHAYLADHDFDVRVQRAVPYDARIWQQFKRYLRDLFHNKCAYCETRIIDAGDIDMFRPKRGAINLDATKSPDHYWWLTYEWENLYLACRTCNVNKGSKFPVNGPRGDHPLSVEELRAREYYLLIDPCWDEPDDHFVFDDGGVVSPRTERGRITIDILTLNRPQLIEARREELTQMLDTLSLTVSAGKYSKDTLEKEISPDRAYSAARRQSAHRFLLEHEAAVEKKNVKAVKKLVDEIQKSTPYISSAEAAQIKEEFVSDQERREEEAVSTEEGTESLYTKSQYISRIVIHNFRVIEDLDIVFPIPEDGKKPWVVLLGENGMGKSSILKAVALTLMDHDTRQSLGIAPIEVLRRGTDDGFVEVYVVPYQNPFRLDFNNTDENFTSNKNVLHTLLFCYGGTRLLPNRFMSANSTTDDYSRLVNLFNPFLPLIDSERWLLDLPEDKFGYTAKAIKRLISADDERLLVRLPEDEPPTEVRLQSSVLRTSDTLQTLSDGYQSVIALVTDILEIMLKHYDEVADSEGIVLIDEIDVHLHPRWKVEIVGMLRTVFPRVQFIMTTHDPLCLLGNRPGEVHVLRRNLETMMIEIKQVDVPPGTTADKILTGFWFGLRSTLDDDTLSLLDQHRKMLRDGKSDDDPKRLRLEESLRERLGTYADTSIDRMALSVASEIIKENVASLTVADREEMRNNIQARMQELLREREANTDANL